MAQVAYEYLPLKFARAVEMHLPTLKGVEVPARAAYSHSGSVGSR
jgi:hypothetical protein